MIWDWGLAVTGLVSAALGYLAGRLDARRLKPPTPKKCAMTGCSSTHDPRCAGGNCTHHCHLWCDGRCLELWKKRVLAGELDLSFLDAPAPKETRR